MLPLARVCWSLTVGPRGVGHTCSRGKLAAAAMPFGRAGRRRARWLAGGAGGSERGGERVRAALLSPERERWAGSRDAGLRRRGELGSGPRAGKRGEKVGPRKRAEVRGKGEGEVGRAGFDWAGILG